MKINGKYVGVWLFVIALGFAFGIFYGIKEGFIRSEDQINILVMGIDTKNGWDARSDSINLVHIDFSANRIGILSIPRDTLVDIPGHGQDKINHAHRFGGPELSCLTVSKFVGVPVDYYMEMNFPMFQGLVDEMGGIDVEVDKPLNYDDYYAGLHIHLNPGMQHLNGYQAMGFVRFRHDNASDWGRIERQHRFFDAFAKEVLSPVNAWRLPSMLYGFSSNIRTNMDVFKAIKVATRASGIMRYGKVDMGYIPGADARLPQGYYMLSDETGMKKEIDRVIYGK